MIRQMLEISTANITRSTANMLAMRTADIPVVFDKDTYGFWVHVPEEELIPSTCPEELRAILNHAIANGCSWIMFDQDVDALKGFPTFDW